MKKICFLFFCLLQMGLLAQDNCGIVPNFEYAVIGNTIQFTNTTQVTTPGVNINYYWWEFSDGGLVEGENPNYFFDGTCGLSVCLTIEADSMGQQETCYVDPLCMPLDVGWWPIAINLEILVDEVNEQMICDPQISGGSGPYAIEVSLDGVPFNYSDPLVIPLGSLYGGWLQVCATDANGCMSCEGTYVTNPFLTCTMDLAVVQQDNFVTVTSVVTMGDIDVEEFEGVLSFDSDSLYQIWANSSHSHYFNDLGIHEICYQAEDYMQLMYPNCPTQACTTIEVTQFAMDCSALFSYQQTGYSFYFANASSGYYDTVIWDFGNGEASTSNNAYVILQPGVYVVSLTVSNSQTNCVNTYQETIEVAMPAHLCMFIYEDANQNGMQDANEVGADSLMVSWGNYSWTVLDGVLDAYVYPSSACLSFGGEGLYASITEMPAWDACFMNNSYLLSLAPNEELCPVNIGIYIPMSTVCGTYYADTNNNGVMDNNEVGIPFSELSMSLVGGNVTVVTDANGNYCIDVPLYSSAWILPLLNGLASDLIAPSTLWLLAEMPSIDNVDFGLYYVENAMDLSISLSQGASVTPGFGTAYYVTVQNYSNLSATATVSVELDPLQTIDWMTSGGTVLANVGTWSIALDPYENWNGTLYVSNSVQMILGDAAVAIATVDVTSMEADINLINNTSVLNSIVVGSYDPNNKLVHPAGEGLEGRISPSETSLQYTINFQNTGSAPAQNIRITDDLPYLLDPSTIVMLQSSHAATMIVEGQHVKWTFSNIQLPDSATNEPLSHGHVTFRILPWAPFIDGQVIQNEAAIYFDFNEPIITNTAVSTIDASVGLDNVVSIQMKLYPNPCSGPVIYLQGYLGQVEIIDVCGRVVGTRLITTEQNAISIDHLQSGFYTVVEKGTKRSTVFVKN